MTFRRRGPVPREADGPPFCLTCLSAGFHRWDCTKVDPKYRMPGPYLPTDDRPVEHEPIVAFASLRDAVASIETSNNTKE